MFPFHTWLPDAHTQAPTVGSVILAAILLKLGTYGFIRIAIPILPSAAKEWAPWIGGLAVVGIIYGALCCLAQTDMKRLIAFSSVSHMGFVMLGIATLTSFGFNAAIFGMVAHGLITGMLFFVAGSVKERYHTLEIRAHVRHAQAGAPARLDPRLLRDGLPRPARPGRVLGRVPGHPLGLQPRRRAEGGDVPRLHGPRRRRHGARRRRTCCGCTSARRSASRRRSSPTTATSTTSRWRSGSRGRRCSSPSSCSACTRTSSSRS